MKRGVYLSGETHTDWRQPVTEGAENKQLAVSLTPAVTEPRITRIDYS
ncbi:MAG: YtoQ family protein [Gammaproteobacteria bacterium]|nr:YtoQ family protein [Gammaproteobacteria bacterium]